MLGQYASEKHYGDARGTPIVWTKMIGELETRTRNLSGTLPDASDDSLPSEVKEPFVFYGFQRERATGVEPATSSLGSFLGPCGARVFRRR